MSAPPDLPTGTVTFLFTDIEGSTKLLHELGPEAYAQALERHHGALRDAFAACGGVEVDTQGDAFFVAFAGAEAAVAAATAAQMALADGPVAVRMGIHTGAPLVTAGRYVGVDVHKAARICAAGHGGQVVLSETTRRLVDIPLRPLGAHRLKDLAEPEPLYQLGEGDFAPLRTLNRSTLPIQTTPFLGRERELGEIIGRLRQPEVRLLTLTGSGGSGKTRLALQAAAEVVEDYPHGVWWVPLQALQDPALVLPAISAALGTTEQPAAHIADGRLLLVLDNLEQVADSAMELAGLLEVCPHLALLATSREVLHVSAEQAYPVEPFVQEEGVGFFLARARAVDPTFSASGAIAAICRRLDNLPLALELAAARVRVLTPEQILERLERRLPLLTGGARDAPERQRTLRAAIAWSHDLLTDDEQRLFARLAAFAGGCTLPAAECVCEADLDVLQSLVDKSLLRFDGVRFTMLETIREFADEQLEASGEADEIRRRHAEHFLTEGESANLSAESEGPERPELVRPEQDNLRRAIDWSADHDLELAFRLAISLEQFWVMNDPFEGARRLAMLLERGRDVAPVLRARALRAYAESTWIAGDFQSGTGPLEESLAEFERLGDETGVAILLHRLGVSALVAEDFTRARKLLEDSLAMSRRLGLEKLEADAVGKLGWVERGEGKRERALELFEESATRCERVGFTWMQASTLFDAAELADELEQPATAEERAREALRLSHELGDRQHLVYGLALLARLAATQERAGRAGRLWGAVEAEEARGRLGHWENEREQYAAPVLAHTGPEFEAGRAAGLRLSLEQAVTEALS